MSNPPKHISTHASALLAFTLLAIPSLLNPGIIGSAIIDNNPIVKAGAPKLIWIAVLTLSILAMLLFVYKEIKVLKSLKEKRLPEPPTPSQNYSVYQEINSKKEIKEKIILKLQEQKEESAAKIEELKLSKKELLNRAKELREKILQQVNLPEKIESIEEPFKEKLSELPILQPREEIKEVPEYENNSKQYLHLYERINHHLKAGDLNAARRDYDALIIIYKKLIQQVGNPKEVHKKTREVYLRLTKSILERRYGKLEELENAQ